MNLHGNLVFCCWYSVSYGLLRIFIFEFSENIWSLRSNCVTLHPDKWRTKSEEWRRFSSAAEGGSQFKSRFPIKGHERKCEPRLQLRFSFASNSLQIRSLGCPLKGREIVLQTIEQSSGGEGKRESGWWHYGGNAPLNSSPISPKKYAFVGDWWETFIQCGDKFPKAFYKSCKDGIS